MILRYPYCTSVFTTNIICPNLDFEHFISSILDQSSTICPIVRLVLVGFRSNILHLSKICAFQRIVGALLSTYVLLFYEHHCFSYKQCNLLSIIIDIQLKGNIYKRQLNRWSRRTGLIYLVVLVIFYHTLLRSYSDILHTPSLIFRMDISTQILAFLPSHTIYLVSSLICTCSFILPIYQVGIGSYTYSQRSVNIFCELKRCGLPCYEHIAEILKVF